MGTSVMRLRKDAHVVAELDHAIFPYDCPVTISGAAWWVARVDGEPAGFGGCAAYGRFAYLRRSGVLPDYRGRGIHGRLVRARIAWARTHDVEALITYTSRDNIVSANNLEDLGFRLCVPRIKYVGKSFLYWRLDL